MFLSQSESSRAVKGAIDMAAIVAKERDKLALIRKMQMLLLQRPRKKKERQVVAGHKIPRRAMS